ncbi:hypothetical protein [Candidatus Electronema sp. PJ]|uniref:hypothetical protein n=1 Tax=Candidatus Electronema sp. PJ TaxID=3401572 RepID=UPI003AA9BFD2
MSATKADSFLIEDGWKYCSWMMGCKRISGDKQKFTMNTVKTILILSANPKDTARLRLDEEVREIENGLRLSRNRQKICIYCPHLGGLKPPPSGGSFSGT